jgi:hypothetical protein
MVTAVVIVVAIIAMLIVIFYAVHKLRPKSFAFRARASVLRLVTLDMKMKVTSRASPPGIVPKDGPP